MSATTTLDAEQAARIRRTFARAGAAGPAIATQFYTRLFERRPELAGLFGSDLALQEHRLLATLAATVEHLERLDTLRPMLATLGRRHVGYGVQPAHYALVGAALIDTLAAALGPAFDADDRRAWAQLYMVIADAMQHGASEAPRPGNAVRQKCRRPAVAP